VLATADWSRDRSGHDRVRDLIEPLLNAAQAQAPQGGPVPVGDGRVPQELEQERRMRAVEQFERAAGGSHVGLVPAELRLQGVERPVRLAARRPREVGRAVRQNARLAQGGQGRRIAIDPRRREHEPHLIRC